MPKTDGEARVAGVRLTHPDRVLLPEQGITKRDLAVYLDAAAEKILAHVKERLVTFLRCPQGRAKKCFVQRHGGEAVPRQFVSRRMGLGAKDFAARIAGRKGQVKSTLMEHSVVAGIGNVFSDEILFHARLHPQARIDGLSAKKVRALPGSVRKVLKEAIKRGAGGEEFEGRLPASWLIPRRHECARCPRGNGEIRSLKFSGRTAYFCPACQPEAR